MKSSPTFDYATLLLSAPQAVAGFGLLCGRILPEIEPALAWAERADAWLQRLGVPHQLQLHDAGHEFNAAMQADFLDWFGAARQRWNR